MRSIDRILVAVALITIPCAADAQDMPYLWSLVTGENSGTRILDVTTDSSGTVVLTGTINGSADFGGGVMSGVYNVFVAKLTPDGNHVWSQSFAGGSDVQESNAVAIDVSGNIILAGRYRGTMDFGGGPLPTAGWDYDIFLVKFDTDGNHIWSKAFGSASRDQAWSVAVDASGNVVVSGYFEGTVDFGGGVLTSAGVYDGYAAKFDAAGNHLWSKQFGDADWQENRGIAIDASGNLVITGYFEGAVDFGGGVLTSAGNQDVFVARLDPGGNHIWSRRFGDYHQQEGVDVALDASGNIALTGKFGSTLDFGGGPFTGTGNWDVYVVKFDSAGNHIWSSGFGGSSEERPERIAADASGNVAIAGAFQGAVDFGGGPLVCAGVYDIFAARFDTSGNHMWSRRFGSSGGDFGGFVGADPLGHVFVAGTAPSGIDFGVGPVPSSGTFLVKYYALQPEPLLASITDVGNDQGRVVRAAFYRSVNHAPGSSAPIMQYEAFRRIDPLPPSGAVARSDRGLPDFDARVRDARDAGMISDPGVLLAGWEFAGRSRRTGNSRTA